VFGSRRLKKDNPRSLMTFFIGVRPATDFEIPSLFPFFLAPLVTLDSEVGTALWANVFAAGLLFVAVYFLVREIPVRTAPLLVWAIVLCSPLLVGLSRSLYLEFTLTAMVSLAFAIYLKIISSEDLRFKVGFAAVCYLGILTKMTFPLFFVLPAAVHVTALMLARRWRESLHLMAAFVLPALLAVATVWLFFPRAFAYYLNFGNTAIPIMYLVGPLGRWSVESFTYYLWILSTFMLGLSAPLLLLSFFLPRWHWREFQWSQMLTPRATLWLWLIGPLILLVPQLVKEPRHVAPCIVPAILLIVSAIESIDRRTLRLAMLALLAVVSVVQYISVTTGQSHTAYFLDRPLAVDGLQRKLAMPQINQPMYLTTPPSLIQDHWRFNQDIALVGFEANEALAVSWALWPAVVVDLHTYDLADNLQDAFSELDYQDLSIVSIFNTLNRRCGWEHYQFPLTKSEVVNNADLLFVKSGSDQLADIVDFKLIEQYSMGGAQVDVWKNLNDSRIPFRMLYGMRYLAAHPEMSEKEKNTVAFDLRLTAVLRGQMQAAAEVSRLFPALSHSRFPRRKIYHIAGMGEVLHREVERNIYRKMLLVPPDRP